MILTKTGRVYTWWRYTAASVPLPEFGGGPAKRQIRCKIKTDKCSNVAILSDGTRYWWGHRVSLADPNSLDVSLFPKNRKLGPFDLRNAEACFKGKDLPRRTALVHEYSLTIPSGIFPPNYYPADGGRYVCF